MNGVPGATTAPVSVSVGGVTVRLRPHGAPGHLERLARLVNDRLDGIQKQTSSHNMGTLLVLVALDLADELETARAAAEAAATRGQQEKEEHHAALERAHREEVSRLEAERSRTEAAAAKALAELRSQAHREVEATRAEAQQRVTDAETTAREVERTLTAALREARNGAAQQSAQAEERARVLETQLRELVVEAMAEVDRALALDEQLRADEEAPANDGSLG